MSLFTQWVPARVERGAAHRGARGVRRPADRPLRRGGAELQGVDHCTATSSGPHEMEQEYGLIGGNIFHGELSLEQLFHMRPAPGYADYRTPIAGLYNASSATHGGGGVCGIPGLAGGQGRDRRPQARWQRLRRRAGCSAPARRRRRSHGEAAARHARGAHGRGRRRQPAPGQLRRADGRRGRCAAPAARAVQLVNPCVRRGRRPARASPDLEAVARRPTWCCSASATPAGRAADRGRARSAPRGAVVFGSAHGDGGPRASSRRSPRDAGMALCGAGCMGFWNVAAGCGRSATSSARTCRVGPVVAGHPLGLGVLGAAAHPPAARLRPRGVVGPGAGHHHRRLRRPRRRPHRDPGARRWCSRPCATASGCAASLRRAREAGIAVVLLPVGGSPLGRGAGRRPLRCARRQSTRPGRRSWTTWPVTCVGDLAELADTLAVLARRGAPRPGVAAGDRARLRRRARPGGRPRPRARRAVRRARRRHADALAAPARRRPGARQPARRVGRRRRHPRAVRRLPDDDGRRPCGSAVTALAVDLVPEYDGDTSYPDAVLDAPPRPTEPVVVLAGLAGGPRRGRGRSAARGGRARAGGVPQRAAGPAAPAGRRRPAATADSLVDGGRASARHATR